MSCVSSSAMAPVTGLAKLSTSEPRRPRLRVLMPSTADKGAADPLGDLDTSGSLVNIAQVALGGGKFRKPRFRSFSL